MKLQLATLSRNPVVDYVTVPAVGWGVGDFRVAAGDALNSWY